MLRLSKMTDYAVVVMSRLSDEPGTIMTAPEIAGSTGVPAPTVAKLLQTLTRHGLARSERGVAGGYVTDQAAADIRLSDVITAVDGPVALTACVDGVAGECTVEAVCPIRGRWDPVNEAIRNALEAIPLSDLSARQPFTLGAEKSLRFSGVSR